jgi:hypothetical protein
VKETLKVIKISNNIFFEVIIEKDDEADQMIDHQENESIESRFEETADQTTDQTNLIEKASFLYTDMKKTHLFTLEMISEEEFNANIIDTMSLLQIDLKIDEILNSDQSEDVQETSILDSSIEDESQSQSSIKSKKNKQSMMTLADAMIMNIRFRK